ncbi:unnamed protein product [Rotaria sp. Silwood1]|nr:unnamed protein product [Rotaria sp. Silwood1]CAF4930246.1 unnamed protein product [Rotaria sp. Silwood1]CAF4945580.1 unnamed protein product [Rotaria sp. Silwood1]CAF4948951.1 unnamed protein product [Rotaria sp. Silwood1]
MGFQCILGNNCTKDTTVWTIPGVVLTCTYYESILTSDLRCFYDQACFDTVLSMYNVDMPDRLPLPSFVRYLPILNKLAPSRFSPTDSLRTLYNNLMVEEWNITGNFDGYYKACAPVSCTYSSAQRLNIIDLVTTIVSLIGGLTVSLRLLIQLATRVIPVIITWWQNQHTVADHPEIIRRTITALVLSRASFESQIEVILHQLIDTVPLQFQRTITFAMELIQSNLIPTSFNTDWFIEYGNASNDYLLRFIPRLYNNDTCNCVVSSTCQEPLQIGPPNLILPGLVIGCSPMNALRISTLECMFSMNCVNRILSYLNYYTELDGSLPSNFTPSTTLPFIIHPLNQSIPSRFLPTAPIGTLIDELFIEDWQNISLYENYFAACQPTMCQYKYIQRNNILLVVTSLLGLYGGLTVSLRFLVWYGICLYRWIKFSNHVHSETAVPRINTV